MRHIDVLIQNKPLKKAIVEIALKNKVPFKYLCREVDIKYSDFMDDYIRAIDVSGFKIDEEKFIKLIGLLGLTVRTTVVVDQNVDLVSLSRVLTEKYEKENGKEA